MDTFFRERRSIVFYSSCCGSVLSCGLFFFIKEQFHSKMVSHYSRLVDDFLEQFRFCNKSGLLTDHSSTFRH